MPSPTTAVASLVHTYADRYSAQDAEGVTELCEAPFLAIRGGEAIHLADREAVRAHFASLMTAYREQGVATWTAIEIDPQPIGEFSAFATVRWNATDDHGQVLRDTRTTYHLLRGEGGWRFLSYTNHF